MQVSLNLMSQFMRHPQSPGSSLWCSRERQLCKKSSDSQFPRCEALQTWAWKYKRLELWCQSHPQHKDYRCNQRRNSPQNVSDLKSSRTLETAAKYPRPETSHPGAGSHVIQCLFCPQFMERGKITGTHFRSCNILFVGVWFGMVFIMNLRLAGGIVVFLTTGEKHFYYLCTSEWEVHLLTSGVPLGLQLIVTTSINSTTSVLSNCLWSERSV